LSGLPLYKMTGSGNDFVMIDARLSPPEDWTPEDIRAACARGTGVGADGLVFLGPGTTPDAVRMTYFNRDGSRAAMCGNAALCSTRLAAHIELARSAGVRLETDAGVYEARCSRAEGRAELHLAAVALPTRPAGLELAAGERRVAAVSVGVPHLVVLVEDLACVDVVERGRSLRHDPALGGDGANVNFVAPAGEVAAAPEHAHPPRSQWRLRTYERGVEGETLACGTGAVAAACALDWWGLAALPLAVWTRSGRRLDLEGRRGASGYDDVWLGGEARMVLRGLLM
jgi:diaminopimelate epimerase